ncbi:MAG: hypothetical protein KGI54_12695 [Pseudomonadota bacterium]|nr:hypothetical protein [Pseudomonadota bacterium]
MNTFNSGKCALEQALAEILNNIGQANMANGISRHAELGDFVYNISSDCPGCRIGLLHTIPENRDIHNERSNVQHWRIRLVKGNFVDWNPEHIRVIEQEVIARLPACSFLPRSLVEW